MRFGIVTASYGNYDKPKMLPATIQRYGDGQFGEATLFTDSNDVAEQARDCGWFAIVDEMEDIATPMLRAKYWKTHLSRARPYDDVIIWVDASMEITNPDFIDLCVSTLLNDDVAFTPHPERTCIRPEAHVTASLARYGDCDPMAQVDFYRSIGHPDNWGLFASGAFVIRNNSRTERLGKLWWDECVNWTYQDQLSLPVITKIMSDGDGLKWNANLPWHEWWTLHPHGC